MSISSFSLFVCFLCSPSLSLSLPLSPFFASLCLCLSLPHLPLLTTDSTSPFPFILFHLLSHVAVLFLIFVRGVVNVYASYISQWPPRRLAYWDSYFSMLSWFTVYFLYIHLARTCLSAFNCERAGSLHYLSVAPYIRCVFSLSHLLPLPVCLSTSLIPLPLSVPLQTFLSFPTFFPSLRLSQTHSFANFHLSTSKL